MKKTVIGLYDETGYMQFLVDYLEKIHSKAESHLFTSRENLEIFLKENEVDVLLLGEEVDVSEISYMENVKNRLVLSEEPVESEESHLTKIFKYQPASKVVEAILSPFGQLNGNISKRQMCCDKTRIYIALRIWENGSGLLEQILEREVPEGKTLIMDMETYSGFLPVSQRNFGLSEFLFYVKQDTEKIGRKLSGLIRQWQEVDYLCPVTDYRDLHGITREEIRLLLHILLENTEYENVIFDVGFPGDASLYLLEKSDGIYTSRMQNEWQQNQWDGFVQFLRKEGMEDIISKVKYLSE